MERLVAVAFVVLKLVIVPEAEVRSVIFAREIVVVDKMELPNTVRLPDVLALPAALTKKLRFSTQVDPFQ